MNFKQGDKIKIKASGIEATVVAVHNIFSGIVYLRDDNGKRVVKSKDTVYFHFCELELTDDQKEAYYHEEHMEQHHETPSHWGI